ncbi:uncharacterized protein LOC135461772 [Liolophura sinensis]|uniref:uncharacterized protein LOC135461772 n=1 Tax=Liolophura sinensis TaxID=3198878 RepID=UPI003158DAA8
MEVVGRGLAYLMAKLQSWPIAFERQRLLKYVKSGTEKCVKCVLSLPPVWFLLTRVLILVDKLRSLLIIRAITRVVMTVANLVLWILSVTLDRKRPFLPYVLWALVSGALGVQLLGFSTPWWIFMQGHYVDPCSHVQGLWEVCIMLSSGIINACEITYQLQKEHPPSSFVNSCGQNHVYLDGVRLLPVRILEVLGLVLATLSEIMVLQCVLPRAQQRRPSARIRMSLTLFSLSAGASILAGVILCQKKVEQASRDDSYMSMDWSSSVCCTAGLMFLLCGVISVRL